MTNDTDRSRGSLVALVTGWEQHDVFLILNGMLPDRIREIRKAFAHILPASGIRLWYMSDPGLAIADAPAFQIEASRLLREALIASLDPDLVVAPLELGGPARDCVFSIGLLHAITTFVALGGGPGDADPPDSAERSLVQQVAQADRIFATAGALVRMPGDQPASARDVAAIGDTDRDIVMALLGAAHDMAPKRAVMPARKPRLAYVSPLPPERSGISFYSAELLPALSKHYDIDIVVQPAARRSGPVVCRPCSARQRLVFAGTRTVTTGSSTTSAIRIFTATCSRCSRHIRASSCCTTSSCLVSSPTWRRRATPRATGSASFIRRMDTVPLRSASLRDNPWTWSGAIRAAARCWPMPRASSCMRESTRSLVRRWHGADAERRTAVIPHLRAPREQTGRSAARQALGLADDDFVVCAFGGLGPTKLNHRLVDAWLASPAVG